MQDHDPNVDALDGVMPSGVFLVEVTAMRNHRLSNVGCRFGVVFAGLLLAIGAVALNVACMTTKAPDRTVGRAESEVTAAVKRWLAEYHQAWNGGDAVKLGRMLGLNRAEVWSLQRLFEERKNFRVVIEDVRIHTVDDSLARVTYVRRDRWIDRETGRSRISSAAYEQSFRLVDGQVREISLRRR